MRGLISQAIESLDDAKQVIARLEETVRSSERSIADLREGIDYKAGSIRRIYNNHDVGQFVRMVYVGDKDAEFQLPDVRDVRFTTKAFWIKNATIFNVVVLSQGGQLIDDTTTQTLAYMDTIRVGADNTDPNDLRWWIE